MKRTAKKDFGKTFVRRVFRSYVRTNTTGFLKKWEAVRAKGFKNYYINSAWRWFVFLFAVQTICHLATFQNDWIAFVIVGAVLSAVFPPLLWKKHQNEYEVRIKKAIRH